MPNGGAGLAVTDDGQVYVAGDRCPKCHGEGVLKALCLNGQVVDVRERWRAKPCDCGYAAHGRVAIAGFPRYLDGKTVASFDWAEHQGKRKAVVAYVESLGDNIQSGRGLMLTGGVGTGKTHIAVAVARLACQQDDWGFDVLFLNVPNFLRYIREGYSADDGREPMVLQRLGRADLIVLDDIAAEKSTDWAADLLYQIVNHRYENMLATFVTANVTLDMLKDRLGERIVSRLYERCIVVDMSGDDYRTKVHRKMAEAQP